MGRAGGIRAQPKQGKPMKRTTFQLLIAAVGLSFVLAAAGCNTVTVGEVRRNMSPALTTTDETHGQSRNDLSRVFDHNTRTAWDDLERLMLIDEPSSLHTYPIP